MILDRNGKRVKGLKRKKIDGIMFEQHPGGGWVALTARVFGNAQIAQNARVSGYAEVYFEALVFGNAWIFENAVVFGNAQVSGNARIYGCARVSGDARISGRAHIFGKAYVCGEAVINGNAWATRFVPNVIIPPYPVTITDRHIAVGRLQLWKADWRKEWRREALDFGYHDDTIKRYEHLIAALMKDEICNPK